jgi:hypothetical protein
MMVDVSHSIDAFCKHYHTGYGLYCLTNQMARLQLHRIVWDISRNNTQKYTQKHCSASHTFSLVHGKDMVSLFDTQDAHTKSTHSPTDTVPNDTPKK